MKKQKQNKTKKPLNKGGFAILYQIWPLLAQTVNQLWQNLPSFLLKIGYIFSDPQDSKKTPLSYFFLKKSIFRPLNTKRVLHVKLKKKDLFFVHVCVDQKKISGQSHNAQCFMLFWINFP